VAEPRSEGAERQRVALVLSGGGARAAYQVGVLRSLARARPDLTLPIDLEWLIVPLALIVVLLAAPAAIGSRPKLRAKLVRRLPRLDAITTRTIWVLVWTTAASWITWGLALCALATGVLNNAGVSPVTYIAAWIGSFLAGVIALVAPAGLGVRDEMMRSILTASGLGAGGAVILVLVARLWTTVLDVVPAILVLLIRKGSRITGKLP